MSGPEMIVAIIAIVSVTSIIRAKMGIVRRDKGEEFIHRGPDPEAIRLREEVNYLKDRVAVLERLATDGNSALEREFEKLRNHKD